MSSKLKQFFQDAKIHVFYPDSEESDNLRRKRPSNALISKSVRLGIFAGLLYTSTGTSAIAAPAAIAGGAWLLGTDDSVRRFVKSKWRVKDKTDDKNNPPTPKP